MHDPKSEEELFSKEEWESMHEVARMLNYFVRSSKYGYVDRLANAYSLSAAIQTLEEALREARSAQSQGEKVHIPSDDAIKVTFELLSRRLEAAKVIASLALAYPSRKEIGGE